MLYCYNWSSKEDRAKVDAKPKCKRGQETGGSQRSEVHAQEHTADKKVLPVQQVVDAMEQYLGSSERKSLQWLPAEGPVRLQRIVLPGRTSGHPPVLCRMTVSSEGY